MTNSNTTYQYQPAQYSTFQNIFGRIWAFWGMSSFILSFIVIFIPSMLAGMLPGNTGQYAFILVSRVWMSSWLKIIGCNIVIKGRENFKKGENYIICYNHNALLDAPLSAPFVPGANKTIAKDSFAKVPIFGFFYRKGSVLVNRKDEQSRRKSFEDMKKFLKLGMHICIYPEGTRNKSSLPLDKFQGGAFMLAYETKKSIIPALMFGTKEAMPIHKSFFLLPKKLELHYLPAIEPGNLSAKELRELTYKTMTDYYVANCAK